MDEQRPEHNIFGAHGGFHGGLIFVGPYLGLYLLYPMAWAILTGIVLMMVLGLFTAKFIFGVQSLWIALGVSPLLGSCWIGFFYVLIRLAQL